MLHDHTIRPHLCSKSHWTLLNLMHDLTVTLKFGRAMAPLELISRDKVCRGVCYRRQCLHLAHSQFFCYLWMLILRAGPKGHFYNGGVEFSKSCSLWRLHDLTSKIDCCLCWLNSPKLNVIKVRDESWEGEQMNLKKKELIGPPGPCDNKLQTGKNSMHCWSI